MMVQKEGARHDKLEQAREGHQPRPHQAVGHEATAERRDGAQAGRKKTVCRTLRVDTGAPPLLYGGGAGGSVGFSVRYQGELSGI